uniref:Receptor-like serine/threonine-protein kinase n=1 Tax=Pohlia nutans TaxID=140635 RepID=A0A125SL74_9BRYO|nr:G-type lectin-domain containing receptor kinase 3 [Pohlia nutans]
MQATELKLQDNGNLVLLDATSTITLWQSFDTPTDTLLPGQSLHRNRNQSLISWRDANDWSDGYYLCTWLPINGSQTLTLSWNGESIASWNATSWSAASTTLNNTIFYPYLIDSSASDSLLFNGSLYAGNGNSSRLIMSSITTGPLRRATLDRDGGLRIYSWTMGTSTAWSVENNWAIQPCAVFAECGPYGVCSPDPESPAYLGKCSCPLGFEFIDSNDELKGCKRLYDFPNGECNAKLEIKKIGDNDYPFANRLYPYTNTTEAACIALCLNDCRCDGAVFWRRDGRCYIKSGPLFNGGYPQDVGNHSAYLKVLNAPLISEQRRNRVFVVILGLVLPVAFVCFALVWWCYYWKRRRRGVYSCQPLFADFGPRKYSLRELSAATKNFSELIGRGGMGLVYKGVCAGDIVAVKRIRHESSEQGFLAEASSISQIRHRNLMQLKGWCIEDGTFLLVYDFMPNGSLDQWLYSGRGRRQDRKELSWTLRYSILTGVAAALAYLHEDWQQCVLHRDIKSSNVLLDADFNAHLGDFGLARLIDHEKMEKTTMMAGTLGYMAPEMPYTGKATKETDVYSFGVLVLEVVCGKKPVDSYEHEDVVLLHRVWRAKEAGDLLGVVDPSLRVANNHATFWASERANSNAVELTKRGDEDFAGALTRRMGEEMARERDEQMRALQLGMLCCLPIPSARPSMRLAHQILSGDVTTIPPLPDSNQFTHLDVMSAIHHTFQPRPDAPPDAPHEAGIHMDQDSNLR